VRNICFTDTSHFLTETFDLSGLFVLVRARAKVCQNISGQFRACIKKLFYSIKSDDFFLSRRKFVVLTAVASVNEVIVIFLQLILFANTAAFFYSLLGLVSHCF